eukprot:4639871-Prymnesium_polylepis.1
MHRKRKKAEIVARPLTSRATPQERTARLHTAHAGTTTLPHLRSAERARTTGRAAGEADGRRWLAAAPACRLSQMRARAVNVGARTARLSPRGERRGEGRRCGFETSGGTPCGEQFNDATCSGHGQAQVVDPPTHHLRWGGEGAICDSRPPNIPNSPTCCGGRACRRR